MTDTYLEIQGFDELRRFFEALPEKVMPYLEDAMSESLAAIHDRVATYPPATEANQPGRVNGRGRPMGYYERGRGWWYPVKQKATLGASQGVRNGSLSALRAFGRYKLDKGSVPAGLAGYRLSAISERSLGTKWTTQVTPVENGLIGEIGTNVSYADYVQGGRQTALAQQRGWQTLSKALEESQEDIEGAFQKAVDLLVEEFGKGS